ncbi:RE1 [Symbiodinium natans]|uniref:RE1 protein n=1 Tax=Symbiodinium natans TaxID=878477 RepID=A0A812IDN9_9DINO|nr:RE1 [Symbiodinium natans]
MLIRNIWLEPSGCPFASVSTKSRARRRYGVKIRALPKRIRGSHEPHLYSCEYDSFCSFELSFHSKATEDKLPFRLVAELCSSYGFGCEMNHQTWTGGSKSPLDLVTWDGEHAGWPNYVRRVRLAWERTEASKRRLLGAQLVSRLKGKAWDISVEVDHRELQKSTGPRYLLRFLEERLLKTPIPDLGLRLEDFFIRLRRQPGVGMAQWSMQVREAYRRLKRSLVKMQASTLSPSQPLTVQNVAKQGVSSSSKRGSKRSSVRRQSVDEPEPMRDTPSGSQRRDRPGESRPREDHGEDPAPDREQRPDDQAEPHRNEEPRLPDEDHPAHEGRDTDQWSRRSQGSAWTSRDWDRWKRGKWWDERSEASESSGEIEWDEFDQGDTDILPSAILGWLLLRRSGLSSSARLAIQSATQNDLDFEKIERALRDQEEELLATERRPFSPSGPAQRRRSFWVEQDGAWGLLLEEPEDVPDEQIHWQKLEQEHEPDAGGLETAWSTSPSGNELEWSFYEGDWRTQDEVGVWWSYADTKPWLDIEEVMLSDAVLGGELLEIYGQFDQKIRTFRESRQVIKDRNLGRGFYPPKGKGKSKNKGFKASGKGSSTHGASSVFAVKGKGSGKGPQRPGSAAFTGCFICGSKEHDYRSCPRRSSTGPPMKAVQFSDHALFMEELEHEIYTIDVAIATEPPAEFLSEEAEARFEIYSTMPFDMTGKAVLDIGATATVGSLEALDALMKLKASRGEHETLKVYPECRRRFRFGNGQTSQSLSYVEIPQRLDGKLIYLGLHTIDATNVPILLSVKTLKKLGAIIDVGRGLVIFQAVNEAVAVRLEESPTGHLLLDLTQDWLSASVSLETGQSVQAVELEESPATQEYVPVWNEPVSEPEHVLTVHSADSTRHVHVSSNQLELAASDSSDARSMLTRNVDAFLLMSEKSTAEIPNQLSSDASAQNSKQKGKGKAKTAGNKTKIDPIERYDYSRTEGPDLRDPRAAGEPCRGNHQPMPFGRGSLSGRNQSAEWHVCRVCHRQAGPLQADTKLAVQEVGPEVLNDPELQEKLTSKEIGLSGAEASLHRRLKEIQSRRGARAKAPSRPGVSKTTEKNQESPTESEHGTDKEGEQSSGWIMAASPSPGRKAARPNASWGEMNDDVDAKPSVFSDVHLAQNELARIELEAQRLYASRSYDWTSCEDFLSSLNFPKGEQRGSVISKTGGQYVTFGLYSHGNQLGICNRSQEMPYLCRYLNAFLRFQAGECGAEVQTWSSFAVGFNVGSKIHRDVHNLPGSNNLLVGMGSFSGGELWRELPERAPGRSSAVKWRVMPDGSRVRGINENIHHRCVCFDPRIRHATCKWTGRRIVLAAFTTRSYADADDALRGRLRGLGFPLPVGLPRKLPESSCHVCSDPVCEPEEHDAYWQVTRPLTANMKNHILHEAQEYMSDIKQILEIFPENAAGDSLSMVELGMRESNLTHAARALHVHHTHLMDCGLDPGKSRDHSSIWDLLRQAQPDWLWLSPPYMQDEAGLSERAVCQRRKRCRNAQTIAADLAQEQIDHGRHFVWIWPADTSSWRQGRIRSMFRKMQQAGLVHESIFTEPSSVNSQPLRRWRAWATSRHAAEMMRGSLEDGREEQQNQAIKEGKLADIPLPVCRRVLFCMKKDHNQKKLHAQECVSYFEGDQDADEYALGVSETLIDPEKMSREDRAIHAQVMKLHRRCGHPNNRALMNLLKTREVDEKTLKIAEHLRCDECQQMRLNEPHVNVALDRSEVLWHTLQIDHVDFRYQDTVVQILVMTDEASQYTVACEMHRRHHEVSRNATTDEVIAALEREWVMRYGFPNKIRLDAEGAFKGTSLGEWAAEAGVELDVIPAEDHSQIGVVERMGGVLKHHAHVLLQTRDMDPFRAFTLMVAAHNECQFIKGYTPLQWTFGRQFSHDRRMFEGGHSIPVHSSEGVEGTSFRENLQVRVLAESVFRKSQAARRITLAMNSKTRRQQVFIPGDLVFYRRIKPPADFAAHDGIPSKSRMARWYGPARVLATETRTDATGLERRPGHVVWIISHGRLKRCSQWQLRHATTSEQVVAEGAHAPSWTFHDLLQHLRKGQFESFDDLTLPEDTSRSRSTIWTPGTVPRTSSAGARSSAARGRSKSRGRARSLSVPRPEASEQDSGPPNREEHRRRLERSRSPILQEPPSTTERPPWLEIDTEISLQRLLDDPRYGIGSRHVLPANQAQSSTSQRVSELEKNEQFMKQKRKRQTEERMMLADICDEDSPHAVHMSESSQAVCQIDLHLPQTSSEWRLFERDATAWAVQALRKTEVRWSTLDAEGREKFEAAKRAEVDQWLQAEATKAVAGHVPADRVVRMRWVLTYKDTGAAKARIVLIGFEDPDLGELVSSSPTMCRRTRQLILQYAAQRGWKCLKADVKSAFLQGPASQEQRSIFAMPVPELAKAMGVEAGKAVQVCKAAYGLVNAPAEFYRAVNNCLQELGYEQLVTEPCCWRFRVKCPRTGKMVTQGLICSHVDDFIICGNEECEAWNAVLTAFHQRFRWSPWEHSSFTHCGIVIKEACDGSKILDHSKYCETVAQIHVQKERPDKSPATADEVSQLRALLGAVQWRSYNSGPQHAFKVSMLLSQVTRATARTLREANKLVREVHGQRHLSTHISYLPGVAPEEVHFVCWTDAAVANREDMSSTGAYLIAATSPGILCSEAVPLSVTAWRSAKLPRVARSSLSAELQAFSEGEEELMFTRLSWAEMCGLEVHLDEPWKTFGKIVGVMVTDAKSLFDVIRKGDLNTSGLGMKDKYSTLEALSLLERLARGCTITRWVNSDAQLADALTKCKADSSLHKMLAEGIWKLVYDENFVSAKKSRARKIE